MRRIARLLANLVQALRRWLQVCPHAEPGMLPDGREFWIRSLGARERVRAGDLAPPLCSDRWEIVDKVYVGSTPEQINSGALVQYLCLEQHFARPVRARERYDPPDRLLLRYPTTTTEEPQMDSDYMPTKTTALSRHKGDPVFQDESGQYGFWDECWAWCIGPFATLEEADRELQKYVAQL